MPSTVSRLSSQSCRDCSNGRWNAWYSSGEAPPGSKAGAAMVAGAVLATVGSLPLSSVLSHVVQWLRSSLSTRTVRVEIDGDVLVLDGVNDETQQQLMREWLDRHPVDAAPST